MNLLRTGNHLKAHIIESLGDMLGTYSLPNGQLLKAIAINPSMANLVFPPQGTKISGLECHIYHPDVNGHSIVAGVNWNLSWIIHLKQWDIKETTLLAAEKIAAKCPYPVINIFRNPPNQNIGQPEVCRMKINCYSMIQ